MKKNDFAIFMVYVAMFVLALCVGLFAIRPIVTSYGNKMPINFIALVVMSLVAGVFLNAILLELGHVLGAKAGGYEITACIIFMLGVKRKDGKLKFGVSSYDGLTGETRVAPKDVNKSSLGAYSFFPILFYIVEVIAMMVLNAVAANQLKEHPEMAWLQIFSITILSVGGMIYLYDIFPFRLDSMNDGYLISLFAHNGNKEAYNYLLLQQKARDEGKPIPEIPVFDDITDFTASLNSLSAYAAISKGDFDGAIVILDKTISKEKGISPAAKNEALCVKLGLLLASSKTSIGKNLYAELDDDQKKYISALGSMPALRCYLLISACIEESESECNYALDKVEKVLKATDPTFLEAEKALIQHDKDFTKKMHPSWDLYLLPWEEKAKKEAEKAAEQEPSQEEKKDEE